MRTKTTYAMGEFVLIVLAFVSSGCGSSRGVVDPNARLDATDQAALQASIERITAGMDDGARQKFLSDCSALTVGLVATVEIKKKGFSKDAFVDRQVDAFKPLNGLTAAEIATKADAARTAAKAKAKTKTKPGR